MAFRRLVEMLQRQHEEDRIHQIRMQLNAHTFMINTLLRTMRTRAQCLHVLQLVQNYQVLLRQQQRLQREPAAPSIPVHHHPVRQQPAIRTEPLTKNDLERFSPRFAPAVLNDLKQRKVKDWENNRSQSIDNGQLYYIIELQGQFHLLSRDYAVSLARRSDPESLILRQAIGRAQAAGYGRIIKGSEVSAFIAEKYPAARPSTLSIELLADQEMFKSFKFYDVSEAGFVSIPHDQKDKQYFLVPMGNGKYSLYDKDYLDGLLGGRDQGTHPENRHAFRKADVIPVSYAQLLQLHTQAFPTEFAVRSQDAAPVASSPAATPVAAPAHAARAVSQEFDPSGLSQYGLTTLMTGMAIAGHGKHVSKIKADQNYFAIGGVIMTEICIHNKLDMNPPPFVVNQILAALQKPISGGALLSYIDEQREEHQSRPGMRHS